VKDDSIAELHVVGDHLISSIRKVRPSKYNARAYRSAQGKDRLDGGVEAVDHICTWALVVPLLIQITAKRIHRRIGFR
jgi:hypothetical protein